MPVMKLGGLFKALARSEAPAAEPPPVAGPSGTVLLVDDDPRLLEMIKDRLVVEQYTVLTAESAEKAILLLAQALPDVIVLDIGMPGLGGLGFLKNAALPKSRVTCPIIIFSGRGKMESFFQGSSVFAFLHKPADPVLFLDTVKRAVHHHRVRHPRTTTKSGRRMLLVVEDDELRLFHLSRCFTEHGFEVEGHDGGHTFLEAVSRHHPELILIKYLLPHRNGPNLAAELGSHPPTRDIPVILYDETATHAMTPGLPNVKGFVPSSKHDHLLKAVYQYIGDS